MIITTKGRDSYGPWTMSVTDKLHVKGKKDTLCPACEQPVTAILAYYQCRLPGDLRVQRTILKRVRRPIGVSCGCYAKFHRQVTHIIENGLRKGYPV